jgi:hypothetical protein
LIRDRWHVRAQASKHICWAPEEGCDSILEVATMFKAKVKQLLEQLEIAITFAEKGDWRTAAQYSCTRQ